MPAKTAKPGSAYFTAIRKALKALEPAEAADAALAAVDALEKEFLEAARDREAMVKELKEKQTST